MTNYAITIRCEIETRMLVVPETEVKNFINILIDNAVPFECCLFSTESGE